MSDLTVARTIAQQLGRETLVMLGARNLVGNENSLTFKIALNAKRVTHIKITLTPMDVYTVEFIRIRMHNVTILETVENVYVDMLHEVIEKGTGLYTHI